VSVWITDVESLLGSRIGDLEMEFFMSF